MKKYILKLAMLILRERIQKFSIDVRTSDQELMMATNPDQIIHYKKQEIGERIGRRLLEDGAIITEERRDYGSMSHCIRGFVYVIKI